MKYKRIFYILLTLVILSLHVSANTTNSVVTGIAADFELYGNGASIVGTNGWYADPAEVTATIIATNYTYAGTPPLSGPGGSNLMSLEAGANVLTNLFDQTGNKTNVYIDMMVQMNPADEIPAVITNSTKLQTAVWLNSSSNLVVSHDDYSSGWASVWGTNSVLNQIAITNGEWIRLTITMDYLSYGLAPNVTFFKVMVNGTDMTNALAYSEPLSSADPDNRGTNQKWFFCMGQAALPNEYLSSLELSGAGMFDDIVITTTDPFGVAPQTYTVSVVNVVGAWITPTNEYTVTSGGSSSNFTINASNGYYIVALLRSGQALAAASSKVLSSITSNVVFSATIETNSLALPDGVTEYWLQKTVGIYTNDYASAAASDLDGDGYTTSEEFLASTDPTNSSSVLKIRQIALDGAGSAPRLKWVSYYDVTTLYNLPAYAIYGTTNIVNSNSWAFVANVGRTSTAPYTNEWTATMGTDKYSYYKVVATNAP